MSVISVPRPDCTRCCLLGVWSSGGQALSQSEKPALDPQKIVRDASWNELHAKSPGRSFSYRQHKVDPKGTRSRKSSRPKTGTLPG